MSIRLDGKEAALNIKESLKESFSLLERKACLAIIHFNEPASMSYLNGRLKIANEVGVDVKVIDASNYQSTKEIVDVINNLNNDETITGIMVDRPVPKMFDEQTILDSISYKKDVDGCGSINLGRLIANRKCFYPCTPKGAVRLVEYYNLPLEGKDVVVIGRSLNVGKPLALLLLNKNATVTVCHSKTKDIKDKIKQAEYVFLCLGKADFLKEEDVDSKKVIVDIGINYNEQGKIVGDASSLCYDKCFAYTPVPGGVGVMTNVCLMENLLEATKQQ